jgi:hypothetical protein
VNFLAMYFLPIGVALAAGTSAPLSVADASATSLVTIGNVLGKDRSRRVVLLVSVLRSSD